MARSVRSETLSQPARTTLSSTGLRSPSSHGMKSSPSQPAGARAARAIRSSYVGASVSPAAPLTPIPLPPPGRPSPGATIISRNQRSEAPPVSWLLIMMWCRGSRPGTLAIWWRMSVRLKGTRAPIHDVVDTARCTS